MDNAQQPSQETAASETEKVDSAPLQRVYRKVNKFRLNRPMGHLRGVLQNNEPKETSKDSKPKLPEDLRLAIVYTDDQTKLMDEDASKVIIVWTKT